MIKLLTAPATGETLSGFGRLDFVRLTVSSVGGMAFSTPPWWTGWDTFFAIKSVTGFDIPGWQCNGACDECPIEKECDSVDKCRLCAWWTSKDGRKGTCEDPAYDGERKRRTPHNNMCSMFLSRWATFETLNMMERRKPLGTVRVYAAAAEAGVEEFSQEDLDQFCETVKRLAQQGVVKIPKAVKEVSRGR